MELNVWTNSRSILAIGTTRCDCSDMLLGAIILLEEVVYNVCQGNSLSLPRWLSGSLPQRKLKKLSLRLWDIENGRSPPCIHYHKAHRTSHPVHNQSKQRLSRWAPWNIYDGFWKSTTLSESKFQNMKIVGNGLILRISELARRAVTISFFVKLEWPPPPSSEIDCEDN